ncbi:MAG: hypothetical protein ABI356_07260 [Steroidobacteraceae bacterium]
MVPILDQLPWRTGEIRALFESYCLSLDEWEKDRADRVKVGHMPSLTAPPAEAV